MNRSHLLRRKLLYLVILVAMLIPLYLLGQPVGSGGQGGGQLARMRDAFDISESDLGEISPASETMKLASLGLRGVAASLLWNKSHEYRVQHEWDRLKATLNNIALLQPHFDKVWEFQAHNLAYNVSTEFDDYRQRYEMVREGTEFLTKGVKQNSKAPRLIWYTGWFYGQKMGMSDEKRQFRRLFADDEVLHEQLLDQGIAVDSPEARGPLDKPDNWLVGRLWLNHGYDVVESGVKIRRQTPLNFYETGPKWRIKHAEAIESEGVLDERAQNAWQMALADWVAFGNRPIPTTASFTIKLDQIEELTRRREEVIEQIKKLDPAVYETAVNELVENLQPVQKDAWRTPINERTPNQQSIVDSIAGSLVPNFEELARKTNSDVRLEAVRLVGELDDINERGIKTEGYRKQINYEYWKTLSQAEQEERTVRARRFIYEAEQANAEAELDKAIELYEKAFGLWAEIFDDYPVLVIDDSAQDLFESLRRYRIAIDSDEFPDDFPLKTFVELMGEYGEVDQEMYEQVRETQKAKAEARRKELELEEQRREAEAKKEIEANERKEAMQADAAARQANTPDASKTKASQPNATKSEAKNPETKKPETKKPDAEGPETKSSAAETPDAKQSDVKRSAEPKSTSKPAGSKPSSNSSSKTPEPATGSVDSPSPERVTE